LIHVNEIDFIVRLVDNIALILRNQEDDLKEGKGPRDAKAGEGVRAVERALEILLAFRPGDRELAVAEVLRRVDLSRPTLYRLLATLQQRGFVVGDGDPLRFRLGPAVAHLAHVWRSTLSLPDVAQPMLRRVWELSRETVALFVPDDVQRVCVAEMESPQPLRFRRGVGYRERLARGASGRAILAFTELDAETKARLYEGLTIDAEELRGELAAVRRRGYAVSRDELIEGAVAVAVPFFDASGMVVGSMGVFGPSVRMKERRVGEIAAILKSEAAQLSGQLGQTSSHSA
jgi:DNA-binding IclR family transcriptional regulator